MRWSDWQTGPRCALPKENEIVPPDGAVLEEGCSPSPAAERGSDASGTRRTDRRQPPVSGVGSGSTPHLSSRCQSAWNRGSDSISVQWLGHIGIPVARCCDSELLMSEPWKNDRLLPSGLVVDDVIVAPDEVVITAHAVDRDAARPQYGCLLPGVHIQYERGVSDVPAHGGRFRVRSTARRFRCRHWG
jgi:hypothetical protein